MKERASKTEGMLQEIVQPKTLLPNAASQVPTGRFPYKESLRHRGRLGMGQSADLLGVELVVCSGSSCLWIPPKEVLDRFQPVPSHSHASGRVWLFP